MNKIFIACPFIKFIKDSKFMDPNFQEFIEDLYELSANYAPEVFLALKREQFGAKPLLNYSCLMDLNEAKEADLVIAIPDDSMGVAVEIGWVSAMNKPIILVLKKRQRYSPLISGIDKITPCKIIFYEDTEREILSDIKNMLESYGKEM